MSDREESDTEERDLNQIADRAGEDFVLGLTSDRLLALATSRITARLAATLSDLEEDEVLVYEPVRRRLTHIHPFNDVDDMEEELDLTDEDEDEQMPEFLNGSFTELYHPPDVKNLSTALDKDPMIMRQVGNGELSPYEFLCFLKSLSPNEKLAKRLPQIPYPELQGPLVKALREVKPMTHYVREEALSFMNSYTHQYHPQCAASLSLGPPQELTRNQEGKISSTIMQLPTCIASNCLNLAGAVLNSGQPDVFSNETYRISSPVESLVINIPV